jgi:uncharacterized protein (TIGR03083 family)
MSDRKAAILDTLKTTRQQLMATLNKLQPADWERQIQDDGQQWSVRQLVAHIASAQKGMSGQIANIAADKDTVPPDFDINRWNNRAVEKAADQTPQQLLEALEQERANLIKIIEELPESSLDKRGRHGSLEIMSVEQIAKLIGTHERDHAQALADKLSK